MKILAKVKFSVNWLSSYKALLMDIVYAFSHMDRQVLEKLILWKENLKFLKNKGRILNYP